MADAKANKMNYKRLGGTGLKVSEICLGAMSFGKNKMGLPFCDEHTAFKILDAFVEAGGNFIDTADAYGESEEILGKWMAQKGPEFRESLVIATKVYFPMGPGPNDVGLSRKHIMTAVEGSLKRLQTTYIDLYQCHRWDHQTPLEETLGALNELVTAGKVRYLGVSNFYAWQIQKALAISEAKGWAKITCLQPEYNLLCRSTEWDLLEVCKNEGLGVIPWSPLAGGWLTGKYKRGMAEPPSDSRAKWAEAVKFAEMSWTQMANEHTFSIVDELIKIGEEVKASPAQVALRWVMQQNTITAPIVGPKSVEHLKDNLGVLSFKLSDEQLQRLNKVSDVPLPYPYRFYIGRG